MNPDVLSHGGRDGNRHHGLRWWHLALAVAMALTGALATLAGSGHPSSPPAAPATGPRPEPPSGAGDLAEPTFSRLLVGGDRLLELDVDAVAARQLPIPGLTGNHYVSSLVPRRGGTVVLVSSRGEPAGRPGTAWAVRDHGGPPVPLGSADQVLPAVTPDRVWLVAADPAGGPALVSERDLRGRQVTASYPVPLAGRLVGDVVGGFLVQRRTAAGPSLEVVDRRSARLLERVARRAVALAAGPHQVAWADPTCHLRCTVHVEDLRTGFGLVVSILDVTRYGVAVPSPDARRLAFTAVAVISPGGSPVPVLLVAGVDDPGIMAVPLPAAPGVEQAGSALPRSLTWSSNGAWVFLATPTRPQRLLAWRLGSRAATAIRFPVPGVRVVGPA